MYMQNQVFLKMKIVMKKKVSIYEYMCKYIYNCMLRIVLKYLLLDVATSENMSEDDESYGDDEEDEDDDYDDDDEEEGAFDEEDEDECNGDNTARAKRIKREEKMVSTKQISHITVYLVPASRLT